MIDTNELRRGNILNGISHTRIKPEDFIVETIDEYGVNVFITNSYDLEYYTQVSPILLTPELLVKFGFENRGFYYFYEEILLRAANIDESGFWLTGRDLKPFGMLILYAHQLQNIVFCLSGKEIKIK